jgi:hypothetical protein
LSEALVLYRLAREIDMGSLRGLRIALIAALVLLTLEGLTGDAVNLFVPFPSGNVGQSLGGLVSALSDGGGLPEFHALEGTAIVVLSLVIVGLSFKLRTRSLRIVSVLAAAAVVSAMVGGVMFVLSGFQDNSSSAQMGGSFIGAYALYFVELYFTKQS